MAGKIYRVKLESTRKNSIGEEVDVNFHEQYIVNPEEEAGNIDYSYNEVHKHNEKFMKMLKIKYDQIKKAKVEAMPKEKKREPEKPKVVEPVEE